MICKFTEPKGTKEKKKRSNVMRSIMVCYFWVCPCHCAPPPVDVYGKESDLISDLMTCRN